MSITINISPSMQNLTDGQTTVKVEGNTVGQCIEELIRRFPGLKPRIFDNRGKLRKYIDIYVNKESSFPKELVQPVKDGDELHIMMLVTGG